MKEKIIEGVWADVCRARPMPAQITGATPLGGGCINDAFRLDTGQGTFFLKVNDAARYPGMFRAERRGLELLRSANALRVPEPIAVGEVDGRQYLLCEWVAEGRSAPGNSRLLGHGLARLHRVSSGPFGLDHDNRIGSLPQTNTPASTWEEFLIGSRIMPQLRLAERNGLLTPRLRDLLDRLMARLPGLFPQEPPALLHGDLWGGNAMTDDLGRPVIFDPAVYFGHREMDLGMMHLFGGFDPKVFDHYQEEYPLAPDWSSRIPLCQVYPLLVHVNLFGGGYAAQTEEAIRPYV
jgi:protein-ribulosamine 3-kinase